MELDELKEHARKVGFPDRQGRDALASAEALTGFIGAMKAEDQRDRSRLRRMMLFSVAAGVFYLLLFTLTWIAPPDDNPGFHRMVIALFSVVLLAGALVTRLRSNELAGIDYAQPIGSFLKSVERRYKPVNLRDAALGVVFFAAFTVAGALGWLSGKDRYFPSMDPGAALILYGAVVAVALVAGLIVGVKEWKMRKAPLLRQVREMRAALESPDPGAATEEGS